VLDLAVPRDVDPRVRALPDVQLIDLDDLERLCPVDVATRRAEIVRAEELAASHAERIVEWLGFRAASPDISALRSYAESIRVAELRRSSRRLRDLSPEQLAAVDALTIGIVNKLMHGPTVALREAHGSGLGPRQSRARIFGLLRPETRRRTA
jgi:glutamyl-tRNA reductase